MTETLRHWDRRTVDTFRKRDGWIGYAEEHGIILDFGDRLEPVRAVGPAGPLPGRMGRVPLLADQLRGRDGRRRSQTAGDRAPARRWPLGTIEPHAGYPAGMPRLMTLDLTGKLAGPHCVLRIKTNMECYYDQAFVAVRDRAAEASLRVIDSAGGAGRARLSRLHPGDFA